jgi:hypothetical protein
MEKTVRITAIGYQKIIGWRPLKKQIILPRNNVRSDVIFWVYNSNTYWKEMFLNQYV